MIEKIFQETLEKPPRRSVGVCHDPYVRSYSGICCGNGR